MCHAEHVLRQGSLPRGAHNLNETQNIHTGHKHREQGISEGHRWSGEPRAGAYSVFKRCPSGRLCGGKGGEQDAVQDGLAESRGIQEGLAGERTPEGCGPRHRVGGKSLSIVMDEERPNEAKTGE